MATKKDLTKEEKIKREFSRLKRIFKDLDKNKLQTVESLIKNAAFMAVSLEELQEIINEEGYTVEYQNGANQSGTKQSDAWRSCRDSFLKSKGYLCERCSTPDDPVTAKIAHHKTYLTKQNINDPYIALSWDNLEALCQDCHNKEHHRNDKKKRYAFDEAGNLISPPIRSKFREGSTPRAGD